MPRKWFAHFMPQFHLWHLLTTSSRAVDACLNHPSLPIYPFKPFFIAHFMRVVLSTCFIFFFPSSLLLSLPSALCLLKSNVLWQQRKRQNKAVLVICWDSWLSIAMLLHVHLALFLTCALHVIRLLSQSTNVLLNVTPTISRCCVKQGLSRCLLSIIPNFNFKFLS